MRGLGLCLWLVCAKSHPWHSIVREVRERLDLKSNSRPHIRLKSHLKLTDIPAAPRNTQCSIRGGLFAVTTNIPGWPPLHTIEFPVALDNSNQQRDLHLSLAHRFGIVPFTKADVDKVQDILDEHDDWKECDMYPILAHVGKPDPATWRDVSP